MSLSDEISAEIRQAQKAGQTERLAALRFLAAQLQNRAIEKRGQGELTPEDEVAVVQKEIKRRREAIGLFRQGGREDLAAKEEAELKILETYAPAMLSPAEIAAEVAKVIAGGASDFNAVMQEAMSRMKGRADGKQVSEAVKASLEASEKPGA